MRRLVVVEAEGSSQFVQELQRAWDAGDAVLPLDPRLPAVARQAVLEAARPREPVEEGDALVLMTSGTTGAPKAAVLTYDAVAAAARATSLRLEVEPEQDRWLACLPLAHVGGLGVVMRALVTGTPLTVIERPEPEALAKAAADGCTLVSLVPAVLPRIDPDVFRVIVLGGSAMPPDLPANAVATYGMTETGGGVVYDGVPLDGVEVRVEGTEIQVRGPMLLSHYRDGTDPKDRDGWLATSDAGEWDAAAGRLRVFGRTGEMIVTGGENVWPVAVERALTAHEQVAEVLVFGRPDPDWGQRVVARVVPVDPADPPTLDQLRDWVKELVAPWAAPRELELTDLLPRTSLGKLRRAQHPEI